MTCPCLQDNYKFPGYAATMFQIVQSTQFCLQAPFEERNWMGYTVIVITDVVAKCLTVGIIGLSLIEIAVRIAGLAIGHFCSMADINFYSFDDLLPPLLHLTFYIGNMAKSISQCPKKLNELTLLAAQIQNNITTKYISNSSSIELYNEIDFESQSLEEHLRNHEDQPRLRNDIHNELNSIVDHQIVLFHLISTLFCSCCLDQQIIIRPLNHLERQLKWLNEFIIMQEDQSLAAFFRNFTPPFVFPHNEETHNPHFSQVSGYVSKAIENIKRIANDEPYMTIALKEATIVDLTNYQHLVHFIELTYLVETGSINLPPVFLRLLEQMILEGSDFKAPHLKQIDVEAINRIKTDIEQAFPDSIRKNFYDLLVGHKHFPSENGVHKAVELTSDLSLDERYILAFLLHKEPLNKLLKRVQKTALKLSDQQLQKAITEALLEDPDLS